MLAVHYSKQYQVIKHRRNSVHIDPLNCPGSKWIDMFCVGAAVFRVVAAGVPKEHMKQCRLLKSRGLSSRLLK